MPYHCNNKNSIQYEKQYGFRVDILLDPGLWFPCLIRFKKNCKEGVGFLDWFFAEKSNQIFMEDSRRIGWQAEDFGSGVIKSWA